MGLSITLIIIIITCIISFSAFSNQKIIDDLIFYPPAITQRNQWYRFFTCGVIHADIGHLLFNMFSLYMFGEFVEEGFTGLYGITENGQVEMLTLFGKNGKLFFLAMYVLALFVCLLPTFAKHKDDYYYRSLGASGAVSAVIFAGILFAPTAKLGFFFIPPVIPGFIFGPVYLIASTYLEKQGRGNVNHSAHIWGALFGLGFVIVLAAILKSEYHPVEQFIWQIKRSLNF
jgi:membrane associated rhomboid family serine protease